jgi:hypothetical protein
MDSQAIEPCALYENIQVSGTSVQLVFPSASSAKLDALLLGRKFACTDYHDTTLLEGFATGSGGRLKDRLGKVEYVLPVQDFAPDNTKILAVRQNGVPVQVALGDPGEDTDEVRLLIKDDGSFINSETLAGSTVTIHCPIYYPEVVLMSDEPITDLKLHIIGRDGAGLLLYAGMEVRLQPGVPSVSEDTKVLKLDFDMEAVKLEPMHGTEK